MQVINNFPEPLTNAVAHETVYNLDGAVAAHQDLPLHRRARRGHHRSARSSSPPTSPTSTSSSSTWRTPTGKLLSTNFYWRANTANPDDLSDLGKLPAVTLDAHVDRADADGQCRIAVTLHNPTKSIALMAHLQLRRKSGDRVLPVFYDDNYISLMPGETRTIHIEADLSDLRGEDALVVLDGWNTLVSTASAKGVSIATNAQAQPSYWPETGLPFQTVGLRQ